MREMQLTSAPLATGERRSATHVGTEMRMGLMASDGFRSKGAVEQESREQTGNLDFYGQLPHRHKGPILDSLDTDFPEPGENEEHTGEYEMREQPGEESTEQREADRDKDRVDQDPGERQKRNQADEREDPLAA